MFDANANHIRFADAGDGSRLSRRRSGRALARAALAALVVLALLPAAEAGAVELNPGDILVLDRFAGGEPGSPIAGPGGVIRVDPATGEQTEVSAGGLIEEPRGIAVEPDNDILIADMDANAVIRVDAITQEQTRVSSGGLFVNPGAVAVEADGDILVADAGAGMVIRVDPVTGSQTRVTAADLRAPVGVAVEGDGDIVVALGLTGTGPGGVIRVDPATGEHTEVSSGDSFGGLGGIALEADGDILVTDHNAPGVRWVDPVTGHQAMLSEAGFFGTPVGVAVEADGHILAADTGIAGNGQVIRVHPQSGAQESVAKHGLLAAPIGVAVVPPNMPPVANDDTYAADEGTQLSVAAAGVLADDTDFERDALKALLASGPSHGTLTLASDGSFNYTPDPGFHGSDRFMYRAADRYGSSTAAEVFIHVNGRPVADDDTYTTGEDTPLDVPAMGLLSNDTDPDPDDDLTGLLVSRPEHGRLEFNGDGSFSYAPDPDYNGSDTFSYRARDGSLNSDTVTVTIDVTPVNDAPAAAADRYEIGEDGRLAVVATGLLGNDIDLEGDALTAVLAWGPSHGTLTIDSHGSFVYVPERDFNGRDSFSYRASDGRLESDPVTVTIDVTAVNDAPAAAGDTYATDEDTPLDLAAPGLLSNDTDADRGDDLTAVLVSRPGHGRLEFNGDGSLSYIPEPDYNGSDSFSYRVNDGSLKSEPVTVTIAVRAVDDVAPAEAAAPAGRAAPVITQLRLGSRCVRPSRSGLVRVRMSLRMARPWPLQVRIDRGVGARPWQRCLGPNPERHFTGSFRGIATLGRLPAGPGPAAATVARRLTLKMRLAPGLYRITVRAKLDQNRLSPPVRRYLRVLG